MTDGYPHPPIFMNVKLIRFDILSVVLHLNLMECFLIFSLQMPLGFLCGSPQTVYLFQELNNLL